MRAILMLVVLVGSLGLCSTVAVADESLDDLDREIAGLQAEIAALEGAAPENAEEQAEQTEELAELREELAELQHDRQVRVLELQLEEAHEQDNATKIEELETAIEKLEQTWERANLLKHQAECQREIADMERTLAGETDEELDEDDVAWLRAELDEMRFEAATVGLELKVLDAEIAGDGTTVRELSTTLHERYGSQLTKRIAAVQAERKELAETEGNEDELAELLDELADLQHELREHTFEGSQMALHWKLEDAEAAGNEHLVDEIEMQIDRNEIRFDIESMQRELEAARATGDEDAINELMDELSALRATLEGLDRSDEDDDDDD